MQVTRFVTLFLGSFLMGLPIVAQQPTPTAPAPRDAQAVLVLQRSLAALTGTATVNDVTLSGTVTRIAGPDNESGTVTLKATAVGQGRVDMSLSSGQRSEVRDTSAGLVGSWCGPDGNWKPIAGHNMWTDPTWFFPTFLISRALSNPNDQISPADAESREGASVEHISISQVNQASDEQTTLIQGLSQIDIYFDSKSLLPTGIAFNVHADDNALINIPVEIKFSNYQVVQGVSVPYQIQKYIQNGLALDVIVMSVQVNAGLSGSDFQAQ